MSLPVAYVINLERRKDRWAKMQEVWSPWFELVRIPAVDMPGNGASGCRISHRMVAAHFLQTEDMITVFEDDNVPHTSFENISAAIRDAKRYVDLWDYVNCSPWLDLSSLGLPRATLTPCFSPLFLRSNYSHNTNFVLYNQRSLHLLNAAMKNPLPLDMFLGRNAMDQWVPISMLAVQDDSPSDIEKPGLEPNVNAAQLYALSEQMLSEAVNKAKV